jgi:hypothetical protein
MKSHAYIPVDLSVCLGAFPNFRKATISFVMSVRLSTCNNSAPTGRIFMKFDISVFFENISRNFNFHYNTTIIKGTLHGDRYTFFIMSRWILLRMRNVSDKICTENQNTHFMFNNLFFRKSWHSWDNVAKYGRPGQATDDNMAHAHCMLDT